MLPTVLYEALPYLYLAVGSAAVFNVDPIFGQVSGLLMAITGLHAWRMRRAYRKDFE